MRTDAVLEITQSMTKQANHVITLPSHTVLEMARLASLATINPVQESNRFKRGTSRKPSFKEVYNHQNHFTILLSATRVHVDRLQIP
jgi:hypothetical protein